MKKPARWGIRVTFKNGQDVFLRYGARVGFGDIVTFKSKKDAELNAESMVAPGLDAGSTVTVVRV